MQARIHRALKWLIAAGVLCLCGVPAQARTGDGRLSGIVLDPSGIPQLGATVWIATEDTADSQAIAQLLTNQRGSFSSAQLRPGLYSVRVSLVGYLPALQRHVRITPNLTTLVKIELGTVFDTLDSLRRAPAVPTDSDDWKWVLRTSAATRPALQWQDDPVMVVGVGPESGGHGHTSEILVDMTSGSTRPGSPSSEGNAPGTGVSYEVPLGPDGKLLVAGQMNYDGGAAGGMATIWLPSGDINTGPVTTLVIRESAPGMTGVSFYGMRLAHSERFNFGDTVRVRVGAEYVSEGLAGYRHSSILPSAEADVRLSDNYTLSAVLATDSPTSDPFHADALRSVLDAMDSLPVVLFSAGRPVLDEDLHAELRLARRLGNRAGFEIAAFHDSDPHQAVFGIGSAPIADAVQDPFSNAFVYDGGRLNTWGARGVYHLKISDNLEIAALYAYAGALAPDGEAGAQTELRQAYDQKYRQCVGARVSRKVPRLGTQVAASYNWVFGETLTPVDEFGDVTYQMDPNLSLSIRQPLPGFLMNRHWEAVADFGNLLAQGYLPITSQDGQVLLMPVVRSFRGGLSFEF
ncbi:MAG: carboxypeptidase-like regulatory domain-containing protein [Candidatus Acidiferrales bacterium]